MNFYNIPERPLDPPEDGRPVVYKCKLCGEPIREGDDYYDIDGLGHCCEVCIEDSKKYDAEIINYGEED